MVSYKWIRKTQVIPEFGVDYNVWGFYDNVVFFDFEVFWWVFVLEWREIIESR